VLPAFLGPERSEALHELGLLTWIEQHRPLLSTILFFRPEYGFDLLVSGLVRLSRRYPSFGCLVMGSGEQLAEAEKRVLDSGLKDNILLLGDVDHEICLALLSRCDVFLRPTLADGDSISVREALSLGIPTVASRVGTRPAGTILFQSGDVDELLASIDLALTVERGGRLPSLGCMDRLLEIYRNADGSKGSACLN
jgi:glycosyltransferase involved in cell wall biosynthesis